MLCANQSNAVKQPSMKKPAEAQKDEEVEGRDFSSSLVQAFGKPVNISNTEQQ